MPGVLTLDQATTTGWAHAEPGAPPTFGHQRMAKPGATPGEIGAAFEIFLKARLDLFRPQYVAFEAPWLPRPKKPKPGQKSEGQLNARTLRILYGLPMMIEAICVDWAIECREATPQEISAFFIGHGGLKSEEKKRRTVEKCWLYGWDATRDEADALALLVYAEAELFPDFRMKRNPGAGPLFMPATPRLTTAKDSVAARD